MEDCIFCKIARGEIPVTPVYSDEFVMAFDDVSPQAPVHTLVIPRTHYSSLNEEIPADVLVALMSAIPKVAAAKGVKEAGYRSIINTGPHAGQTVHHVHVHVIGGKPMPEGMVPSS